MSKLEGGKWITSLGGKVCVAISVLAIIAVGIFTVVVFQNNGDNRSENMQANVTLQGSQSSLSAQKKVSNEVSLAVKKTYSLTSRISQESESNGNQADALAGGATFSVSSADAVTDSVNNDDNTDISNGEPSSKDIAENTTGDKNATGDKKPSGDTKPIDTKPTDVKPDSIKMDSTEPVSTKPTSTKTESNKTESTKTDTSKPSEETKKPVEHIHTYQLTRTVSPTCLDMGKKVYTCSGCGDQYADIMSANGHQYEWVTTDISKDRTCTVCHYVVESQPLDTNTDALSPSHDHHFVEYARDEHNIYYHCDVTGCTLPGWSTSIASENPVCEHPNMQYDINVDERYYYEYCDDCGYRSDRIDY